MDFTVLIPASDESIREDCADNLAILNYFVHCEMSRSDRWNTTVAVGAQCLSNSVTRVIQLCAV